MAVSQAAIGRRVSQSEKHKISTVFFRPRGRGTERHKDSEMQIHSQEQPISMLRHQLTLFEVLVATEVLRFVFRVRRHGYLQRTPAARVSMPTAPAASAVVHCAPAWSHKVTLQHCESRVGVRGNSESCSRGRRQMVFGNRQRKRPKKRQSLM